MEIIDAKKANELARNAFRSKEKYENIGDCLFFDNTGITIFTNNKKIYVSFAKASSFDNAQFDIDPETQKMVNWAMTKIKVGNFFGNKFPVIASTVLLAVVVAFIAQNKIKENRIRAVRGQQLKEYNATFNKNIIDSTYYMNLGNER